MLVRTVVQPQIMWEHHQPHIPLTSLLQVCHLFIY